MTRREPPGAYGEQAVRRHTLRFLHQSGDLFAERPGESERAVPGEQETRGLHADNVAFEAGGGESKEEPGGQGIEGPRGLHQGQGRYSDFERQPPPVHVGLAWDAAHWRRREVSQGALLGGGRGYP